MGSGSSVQKAKVREAVANAIDKAEDVERSTQELERFVIDKIEYHAMKAGELEKRFQEFIKASEAKVKDMERNMMTLEGVMQASEQKVRDMDKNMKTLEERMLSSLGKVDCQLQDMESKSTKFEEFVRSSREEVSAMESSLKLLEERSSATHRELQGKMKLTLHNMEESFEKANFELDQMQMENQEKYDRITRYLESVSAMGEMFTYAGRALGGLSKMVFHVFYFPWWVIFATMRWYEHVKTKVYVNGLSGIMAAGNGRYRFRSYHKGIPYFKSVASEVFLYFVPGKGWHLSPNLGSTESWACSGETSRAEAEQLKAPSAWICRGGDARGLVTMERPCCCNTVARPVFWWLGAVNAVMLAWAIDRFVNPLVDIELLPLEVPFAVWALSIALLVTLGSTRGWRSGGQGDDVYKQVLAMLGENTEVEMYFDENVMFIFGMLPALISSFLVYYFTRELAKSMDCSPLYNSGEDSVAYCMAVSENSGFEGQQEVCCRVVEEARFTLTTFIAFFMSNAQAGYVGVKYAVRMAIATQKEDGKAEDLLSRLRSKESRKVHDVCSIHSGQAFIAQGSPVPAPFVSGGGAGVAWHA